MAFATAARKCRATRVLARTAIGATMTLAVAGTATGSVSATSPASYQVIGLSTMGGSSSYAYGVNNNLEAAGQSTTATNGSGVWFKWQSYLLTGAYNSSMLSSATGINDLGHVVGYIGATNGSTASAFAYDTKYTYVLKGLGGTCSHANGINDMDEIAGYSYVSGDCSTGTSYKAVLWVHRQPQSLGALIPTGDSMATAINYKKMITGMSDSASGHLHAFFWHVGKMKNAGVLAGAMSSEGLAINSGGGIAGKSTFADSSYHAFFKSRKARNMHDLGTLGGTDSVAYGVGRSKAVVGSAQTADGSWHAFFYKYGRMTDLNTLIAPGSGWVLQTATAINDHGDISGYGTIGGGATQAFILIPNR
jgi:probable HAF family extracellular repeat protein